MKRVIIICEGETEREFCQKVLAPHLAQHDISCFPHFFAILSLLARICNPSVGNVTLGLQIRASVKGVWRKLVSVKGLSVGQHVINRRRSLR